ncbi:MAG: ComF family protein [Clostridia bacterium]|nr:ComF family protein [Clostridia bacterium]
MGRIKEKALALRDGFERFAGHVLFPESASCQVCGEYRLVNEKYALCEACMRALETLRPPSSACDRCLFPMHKQKGCLMCRSRKMQDIDKSYAPFCYRKEVRKLIHELKFECNTSFIEYLGDKLFESLPDRAYDGIVPVPLNKKRLEERGMNQAELLAEQLSKRTGIPVLHALSRSGYQKPQSKTPVAEREKNIQGCFHACMYIEGKRLLLVDDVRTTGSTAQACAKELKNAGAAYVGLCTAAVVYRHPKKMRLQRSKNKIWIKRIQR